jgi:hypothetical protein
MKNRFNWVFEILHSDFFNAASQYARRSDPRADRDALREGVEACIASARARRPEFPDEPQYELFLNGYVEILEGFLRDMTDRDDLEPLLAETKKRITALEDDIRIHLK